MTNVFLTNLSHAVRFVLQNGITNSHILVSDHDGTKKIQHRHEPFFSLGFNDDDYNKCDETILSIYICPEEKETLLTIHLFDGECFYEEIGKLDTETKQLTLNVAPIADFLRK